MKKVMLAAGGGVLILIPAVLLAKARASGGDEGGGVLVLIYLAVAVIASIFVIQIKRRAKPGIFGFIFDKMREQKNPAPSVIPSTQTISRKCPQCGAELKPDVSEGLCPACLLQRGIATEGGAPPGTPPFVPPMISDLARLFPQLEILELIGKGGMGAVYKARQPALDRFVALKILAPRSGGDVDFAERFTREARALAKLSHPNIVAVYDFGQVQRGAGVPSAAPDAGETPALHYFIMEYVDGPNLRQIEQAGKLSPREALEIIPQICAALQFAHDEGIVHRDIKPENILLDKKGRVKIADFGLAKILGPEPKDLRLTGARDVMGTPHYMAPEQVEKPQTVDHRADIYSLGVVFYEMLTGELPLGKFQPPSSKVQIDVRLDEVVLHALEKEPERRYQQASQVKTAVETIATTPDPSRRRREESQTEKPEGQRLFASCPTNQEPRFSRTAIVGMLWTAMCLPLPLVAFYFLSQVDKPAAPWWQTVPLAMFGMLGLAAPIGTTVFGWIAVTQIRHSEGKFYGLGLALFNGLLFPLLVLDTLLGFLWIGIFALIEGVPVSQWVIPVSFLTASLVDFWIIRRVWHAVNQPVAGRNGLAAQAPLIHPPDCFWRRFAVVMVCVVLIPVAIAILGMLAAIAIPNFVRARQHSQQIAVQQWTQQGWQLWQEQKLDEAAAKFRQAVELDPDNANAWNGLGWATFNSGNTEEAEKAFQKAVLLDTNQPGALNGLGQIYLLQQRYDQAETYLLKAAPQASAAWFGLARLYLLEGKFDQAEKWAQKLADSGQADDVARQMLQAAQEKHLSEGLRFRIEPPPAANETGSTPAGSTSTNFVSASAAVESAADYGQTVAGLPPVVVETWPVSGARDVQPGEAEIRVRFSKEMSDGSWSWSTTWQDSTPESIGEPSYEPDHRTCVLKVKLEPGRTYAWWLNSDKFKNFTDQAGRPAVPYLLIFQTKQN